MQVATRDRLFEDALKQADLVVPDGAGMVLASRILWGKIRQRITGTDIFMGVNRALDSVKGRSCFFLGSTDQVLDLIRVRMMGEFPDIQQAGFYSPPFVTEFSADDCDAMIAAVNAVEPDVLWVGMTAPKQEKWILENRHRLKVKFIGAIGAAFDFYAGNVKRSHPMFQRLGLEWLPRLLREPRRLWRRTLVDAPVFLCRVILCRLKNKDGRRLV